MNSLATSGECFPLRLRAEYQPHNQLLVEEEVPIQVPMCFLECDMGGCVPGERVCLAGGGCRVCARKILVRAYMYSSS